MLLNITSIVSNDTSSIIILMWIKIWKKAIIYIEAFRNQLKASTSTVHGF